VRSISSFLHAPGSGRRLFATAGLAALAATGASFSGTPTASAAPSLDKAKLVAQTAVPAVAAVNPNTPRPDGATSPAVATQPAVADSPQLKLSTSAGSVISGRTAAFSAIAKHHDGRAYGAASVEFQQLKSGK
jgi:hypothetical protein